MIIALTCIAVLFVRNLPEIIQAFTQKEEPKPKPQKEKEDALYILFTRLIDYSNKSKQPTAQKNTDEQEEPNKSA